MLLTVAHRTTYGFDSPRARVAQSHRLTPADNDSQTVLDWRVTCPEAGFGAGFIDGAGDRVTTMTVPGPVETLEITVAGSVRTTDTAGVLRGHAERIAPDVYLRKTRTTAPGVALAALAEQLGNAANDLDAAHEMAQLIAEAIEYTPGATHAAMTATEAIELGKGVCQDQAQALIALARMRGMPARYVTGYLFAESEGAAEEASHAWAELHIAGLGWVGFDAANRCCPDDRYIRLGSGMDALDAAPIRGISLGGGHESLDISVNVAQQ